MKTPSIAAVVLFERCLVKQTPQACGSFFQRAVAHALARVNGYQGCYQNPGAGQPDIIAGTTGFEVKSTESGRIELAGNYEAIRPHYKDFRLVALRTDIRPFALWVLQISQTVPRVITLGTAIDPLTPPDESLELALAQQLSFVVETAGTLWSDASSPTASGEALTRVLNPTER